MTVEIWDLNQGKRVAHGADFVEFGIYGNNQLYLFLKSKDGSTEYTVLMPGWQVRSRP